MHKRANETLDNDYYCRFQTSSATRTLYAHAAKKLTETGSGCQKCEV